MTEPPAAPVGLPVPGWVGAREPDEGPHVGRTCRLERLHPRHGPGLWTSYAADRDGSGWRYLSYGPFRREMDFADWAHRATASTDPQFFAVVREPDGPAVGVLSLLRPDPPNGVIEVGHIHFSPGLRRSTAATEAMTLVMRHVFDDCGYRRLEWKCDSLNAVSRVAAERLGFTFEGIFRQHVVYKGRNRDTAWYSMLDVEWHARRAALEAWLAPSNFDADGNQLNPLPRPHPG